MYKLKDQTIKDIYDNQVVLVVSGTGSGKTVLTPKLALHALNYQGRIAITNPKRLPSEENAKFAAKTLDVKLGSSVGVKYRGSSPSLYSKTETKLLYCTDGYVLARLMSDPMLSDLDCVIIDEAHERGVQIDLLLLLLKALIKRRPDFKLIIMSATVNESIFIDYFPLSEFKFAFIDAGGKPNFPIKEIFLNKSINKFDDKKNLVNKDYIEASAKKAVEILTTTDEGDILVFFAGKGESAEGCMFLHQMIAKINKEMDRKIYCEILHSGTDDETKRYITTATNFKNHPRGPYERKVIFATEVAESSITFDGVDFVIDTGLVNQSRFYSEKNMVALEKIFISKASHTQRKGRTGRTKPGTCYNMFTSDEYEKQFLDYAPSPITLIDIAPYILKFFAREDLVSHVSLPFTYHKKNKKGGFVNNKNNKLIKPDELSVFLSKFIEVPPEDSVKRALNKIFALGGMDVDKTNAYLNDMGKSMADFDTGPEIGRMLVAGYNYKCRDEMCTLAGIYQLTNFRMDSLIDIRFRPPKSFNKSEIKKAEQRHKRVIKGLISGMGDHFALLNIYKEFSKRRYDKVDRKTGRVITEKMGGAREWCKENFLNYNRWDRVKYESKDFQRKFGSAISREKNRNPNKRPNTLFLNKEPVLSDKKEDNILKAILKGTYINLIRKEGRVYSSCFPEDKIRAGLSRDSLFGMVKAPTKYAVYSQLKSIFGRASYGIVSKVPPNILTEMKEDPLQKRLLEYCFKESTVKKDTHGKKQYGKKKKIGKKKKFGKKKKR
tara:strand:- start:8 stop:2335 length:2328 start_codon:yes stop_codon:yes gene_type:complete